MKFTARKRRQPPAIIIVSLIDVLIVVLIFLMVTTTFKKQPALKLSLPESRQKKPGASENAPLIVTIGKTGPIILGDQPVTFDTLQQRLIESARQNPQVAISIAADTAAPWGQVVKVMDAVKAANIHNVSAMIESKASE